MEFQMGFYNFKMEFQMEFQNRILNGFQNVISK